MSELKTKIQALREALDDIMEIAPVQCVIKIEDIGNEYVYKGIIEDNTDYDSTYDMELAFEDRLNTEDPTIQFIIAYHKDGVNEFYDEFGEPLDLNMEEDNNFNNDYQSAINSSTNTVIPDKLTENIKSLNNLITTISETEENTAKYYYIVNASYIIPGYYWNDDIHAYTPEGDRYVDDGQEISKLYTWQELLNALDDAYLLTDDVPDDAPTEVLKEESGNKILLKYFVEDEKEEDDEHGHYETRYYTYEVLICIKE